MHSYHKDDLALSASELQLGSLVTELWGVFVDVHYRKTKGLSSRLSSNPKSKTKLKDANN